VVDATASTGSGQRCQDQRSNIRDRFHRARGGFRSAHPGCWLLSWEITFVTWELLELRQRLVRSWHQPAVGRWAEHVRSSMFGLQISHIVVTLPFSFLAVTAALQQVDPTLEEASASLGAGALETFSRVVLPMLRPGLFTGALFAFIVSFDMFTMSFLLKPVGGNTLPLALFDYLKYDFDPTAAAAATVSVAFALVVVLLVERSVGLRRAF
jgi:ABC-type spermidine/putrescine transport system permease subunit II